MTKNVLSLFVFAGLTNAYATLVHAQEERSPITTPKKNALLPSNLGAKGFEEWMIEQESRTDFYKNPPSIEEEALLKRFQEDRNFTDITVLKMVSYWKTYDYKRSEATTFTDAVKTPTFDQSRRFVQVILPYTEDRPLLRSQLFLEMSYFFRSDMNPSDPKVYVEKEVEYYKMAILILENVQGIYEIRRLITLQNWANREQNEIGNNKEAERLYIQILGESLFWKSKDPLIYQQLLEIYTNAGRGLISVRKGNLKALKSTYFVPATSGTLGEELERAIVAAGGNAQDADKK